MCPRLPAMDVVAILHRCRVVPTVASNSSLLSAKTNAAIGMEEHRTRKRLTTVAVVVVRSLQTEG